ncbi:MAG: ABC transporter permease [Candidatus Spechtbacterales bacterium]
MRSEVAFYALRRLAVFPVYFLVFSLLIFFVVMYAPGDPIDIIAGPTASEETRQLIREQYGFDRPLYEQYFSYMGDFLQGDFGDSLRFQDRPVAELLWERIQVSAPLGLVASVIGVFLGILVGLFATFKRGTWIDTLLLSGFLVFAAIPSLLLIQFFILLFSLKLGWLPAGWQGGWEGIFTTSAIIPILTLSLVGVIGMARFVRTITLGIMDEQYVRTAKAKGLHPSKIATRYVLRNAWLPLMTVLVPIFFTFFEGSFFVEQIYGIPGLARFTIDSVFGRDYPVILAVGIIGSMLSIFIILVVDILYFLADPRISLKR